MSIHIIDQKIVYAQLKQFADENYGTMIKGVVDVERKILALGGELHADAEAGLLKEGSKQKNLWGFNIHINTSKEERVEYFSFINIRPSDGNHSMIIQSEQLKAKIKQIVDSLIGWEDE